MSEEFRETPQLPEEPSSYWREHTTLTSYTKLNEDKHTDVVIAGGGITGITTAYLCAKAGFNVVLLEAGRILDGTTGYTTAKVTAQHQMIYDQLRRHFGDENARLYYEANVEAMAFIEDTVETYGIDCDYEKQDAYVYTTTNQGLGKLKREHEAYEELNIPGSYVDQMPLSLEVKGALKMPDQGQFDPVKFASALLAQAVEHGAVVFEDTLVEDVNVEDGVVTVTTDAGYRVMASHAADASHFPFHDHGEFFFARLHAEQSYTVAAEVEDTYPGGMYISLEKPVRSIRSVNTKNEKLWLFGGEGHKTGQGQDELHHYEALKQFADENFTTKSFPYRWSSHDIFTLDNFPLVGEADKDLPKVYTATGFQKWGMTNGTVAAMIIAGEVTGEKSRYASLFSPQRFVTDPSLKTLLKQGANTAGAFMKGKFGEGLLDPEELNPDEGSHVKYEGSHAGAYRDKDGRLHIVDTTCTHMQCEVEWNEGDRTWDCPCHGSRFNYDGEVLTGPAKKPLEQLNVSE
ncbi:glycine/D-amino acid oxidase-like deaminating enzyme [Salsuginibacillus halophilus]|uniref:Glycine/D-amino acid oxidase-like deaminating enzyme n=1 Tax=Salsuginibacillus halophilus TaxID=517424 RepID=A0A2P8HLK0_9BACI|nr:FAD-dependent oxidoreductase [Salsuginibacillus halophilus]PSL47061.1 glycine/D-amino acid oxidase-like deaminating enzyme [Salsuginibacillus halophilus]